MNKIKGLFKVKFADKRTKGHRGQPRDAGNFEAQPWQLIVQEIAKVGIGEVEDVRHDNRGEPKGQVKFDGKEMLALWKAVERQKSK